MIKGKKLTFFLLGMFLILPKTVFGQENLLKNGGFEEGITYWHPSNTTTVTFISTNNAKVGTQAAVLTKKTAASYGYFYQRVPVESEKYYQLAGYVLINDQNINNVKLRQYFLDENEQVIPDYDKTGMTNTKINDWQLINIPQIVSPQNAFFAEIQGYVYLDAKDPLLPAMFDEISFIEVELPTNTPVPTETPTPIPPTPTSTPVPTDAATPTPTLIESGPTPAPISHNNIYISEVMVDPEPGEKEWVEVFNNNDYSVALTGWFIDDAANSGSSPKSFSLDLAPFGLATVEINQSMFNNAGDEVRLLDFDKVFKDGFEYGKSEKAISWGRISFDSDEFCFQTPSKEQSNTSCLNEDPTPIKSGSTPVKTPMAGTLKTGQTLGTVIKSTATNVSSSYLSPVFLETKTNNRKNKLLQCLSFISSSFSLLTIASVFLRIKLN